ncbi:MAG: nucleotidyltransferase family protein [Eubacterium sp.]|nr:nucleotidyltransferase family protein [Eubacterium sp.]
MIFGIICEFNPFHAGHKYLIDTIKGEGDGVICAMSSSFVQRGEAAVYTKFDRAKAAVENGADLVIELVTPCAVQSAQRFAECGVKLLEATGICDTIAFGAECGDTEALKAVANEIKEKDAEIKKALKGGCSYPAARRQVVSSPLLDTPNNILAIEYLSCTKLNAVAVERIGKGHDSDDELYSASEIRKRLADKAELKNCETAVLYKLRTMSEADFAEIEDVSEGLENRIVQALKTARSLEGLYDAIKTKRYTHSRIRRIILRAYLGINRGTISTPQYIRVLSMNEKGKEMLSEIAKFGTLPIVNKYKDAKEIGGKVLEQFENESLYTDIHALCFKEPLPCEADKTFRLSIVNGIK